MTQDESSDSFQLELIDLQSNNSLNSKYNNLSLLEFYKFIIPEKLPSLHINALNLHLSLKLINVSSFFPNYVKNTIYQTENVCYEL